MPLENNNAAPIGKRRLVFIAVSSCAVGCSDSNPGRQGNTTLFDRWREPVSSDTVWRQLGRRRLGACPTRPPVKTTACYGSDYDKESRREVGAHPRGSAEVQRLHPGRCEGRRHG